jgi:hypothetical protein
MLRRLKTTPVRLGISPSDLQQALCAAGVDLSTEDKVALMKKENSTILPATAGGVRDWRHRARIEQLIAGVAQ